MATYLHPDIFDNGLTELSSGTDMSIVVCDGAPTTRDEASTLLSGDGYRVSDEITLDADDVTLESVTDGRQATIAEQTGSVAEDTTDTPELWVAIYDDTRLLVVTDETSDQSLTEGNPLTIPAFNVSIATAV